MMKTIEHLTIDGIEMLSLVFDGEAEYEEWRADPTNAHYWLNDAFYTDDGYAVDLYDDSAAIHGVR